MLCHYTIFLRISLHTHDLDMYFYDVTTILFLYYVTPVVSAQHFSTNIPYRSVGDLQS